jgi:hypothetical protein
VARAAVAALALALAGFGAPAQAQGCSMAAEDVAWLESALDAWRKAEVELLGLAPQPLPLVAAIDGQCTYLLPQGAFEGGRAAPHGETVVLPDGAEAPLGPISFASGEGRYFAMSLPSVWRAAGVTSEAGLERMMTGVLLHEMMHVRQTDLANRSLPGVAASLGISDDELNDDLLQERFSGDAEYVRAYEAERDLLFAAAAEPSADAARGKAAAALVAMRSRRERWFAGDKAGFAALDDVFLTMEGMGQWLIYRHFLSPEGGGLAPADAIKATRRGQRWWSQDEGLALMLVVDRLLPKWQERAFRDPDWRAQNLLEAVLKAGN